MFLVVEEFNQLTPLQMVKAEHSIVDEVTVRDGGMVPIMTGGKDGWKFATASATVDVAMSLIPNNHKFANVTIAGVRVSQETPDPIRGHLDRNGLATDGGQFAEILRSTMSMRPSIATVMDWAAYR